LTTLLHRRTALGLALTCLSAPGSPALGQEVRLPTATPQAKGVDAAKLEAARAAGDSLPALLSLLVWRDGALVAEHYFHGGQRDSAFNVKSVSKSVLSAIAGLAVRDGLIDLERPIARYLPEYFSPPAPVDGRMFKAEVARHDSTRRLITPRHLLTMTTGQGWDENGTITMAFLVSSEPVRMGAELPMVAAPGTRYNYNTGATHLLAAVLHRVTGGDLVGYARAHLFEPLGIAVRRWEVDPQGVPMGGSEMFFTARDLIRFGVLYLQKGRIEGRQVVPERWVDSSLARHQTVTAPTFTGMIPGLDGYGLLWWRRSAGSQQMFCALGFGGQYVMIVPERRLVVAGGSALDARNPGTASQVQAIFRIVDGHVVPAAR
jgi:hypothetical protein